MEALARMSGLISAGAILLIWAGLGTMLEAYLRERPAKGEFGRTNIGVWSDGPALFYLGCLLLGYSIGAMG